MKTREKEESFQRGALKLKPAARYLSVSPITLRRLVERGLLKPNRATRHLLFPMAELDRFLSQ
jgi:excisionase family DNA binding protein